MSHPLKGYWRPCSLFVIYYTCLFHVNDNKVRIFLTTLNRLFRLQVMFNNPYPFGMLKESVYFTVLTLVWSKFLSLTSKLWIILYGFNHFTEFKRFLTLKGKKKSHLKEPFYFCFCFCHIALKCYMKAILGRDGDLKSKYCFWFTLSTEVVC